ncbi:hypothetical protein [Tessaracoccus sp. Y1736]
MTEPQPIATLPPIEELHGDVPRSPRTGEPTRPAVVLVSAILQYLAVAALAAAYGWHWWLAAHPDSYATSARLIEWVAPEPGKWLSLTLEGGFAAALVLATGACGVVGFHAWNGWRWTRWGGLAAVALAGGFAAILSDWAFIGLGLAVVGGALLFLPPSTRYFRHWEQVRAIRPEAYRRPSSIFYGRLPRFR